MCIRDSSEVLNETPEPAAENSDNEILDDAGGASEVLNETPEPAEIPTDTLQTSTPEAAPADTTGS